MFHKSFIAALAVLVTVPTLLPAQSAVRRDRYTLPAIQIDENSFEIVEADGAGGAQMWCAAGLYTRKVLGVRGGDIAIEVPRGPSRTMPGRKAVTFTTDPSAGTFNSVSLNIRRAGLTFSMTHANALCREFPHLKLRTGPNTLVRR